MSSEDTLYATLKEKSGESAKLVYVLADIELIHAESDCNAPLHTIHDGSLLWLQNPRPGFWFLFKFPNLPCLFLSL